MKTIVPRARQTTFQALTQLDFEMFGSYLEGRGWVKGEMNNKGLEYLKNEEGNRLVVVLPTEKGSREYPVMLIEAIKRLAFVEQRPVGKVASELISAGQSKNEIQ